MEREYMREDYYPSAVLTIKVGVVQECEYSLGWGTNMEHPHRSGGTSKISITINILQGSNCSLEPGDWQGYWNTNREMYSKCLLAYVLVIGPKSVCDF